jgi:hypothetical protein
MTFFQQTLRSVYIGPAGQATLTARLEGYIDTIPHVTVLPASRSLTDRRFRRLPMRQ